MKASRQNLTADIVSNFLGYETKDTVVASESELVAGSIEFDEFMKAKTLIVYQTIISGHVNALKSLYIDKKLSVHHEISNAMNSCLKATK